MYDLRSLIAWVFIALILPYHVAIAVEKNPALLDTVSEVAHAFAHELAQDQNANYQPEERELLRGAAQVLLERQHCDAGLATAKQAASGNAAEVQLEDWLRLARAGLCAKNWQTAVAAAYLTYQQSSNDSARSESLFLLGEALEAHPNFGERFVLAAYLAAANFGIETHALRDKIAALRNKIAAIEKRLAEAQALRVERFFVQRDGEQPSICLDFSATMPEPNNQAYADYLRFEPAFSAQFRKNSYDEVCADGAAFGVTYQLRLLPGLIGSDGLVLTQPVDYRIDTGDRPPTLWFANSRYVLPREGGGVPVHGINVTRASLAVYRIVERNLLNEEVRTLFRQNLNTWQAKRIRDQLGERVWQGDADLVANRNREAVTQLPLTEWLRPEPGIYVLTATPYQPGKTADPSDEENYGGNLAALWLLVSDLGISTYQGADGLTVVTRSLANAQPLAEVKLAVFARNNRQLATAVSDSSGVARIPVTALTGTGGREPVLLMADDPRADFNFLDISVAPYDLSDRGVAGRATPGPVDAFLYTERGVYRPGETVHVAALLRNEYGQGLDGLPLTLRVLRPDEQVATESVLHAAGGGGYNFDLPLLATARTGHWKIQAYLDPKSNAIGNVAFQVEAIVPPRIEVDVTSAPAGYLKAAASGEFAVRARYLFGAPAADLTASAELRIASDPAPFPEWAGYQFGPVDEVDDSVLLTLPEARTNERGDAQFVFQLERLPNLHRPLQARLRAEVTDVDGRAVAATQELPVRHLPVYIGIKPPGTVQEGAEATLQIVVLNPNGQSIAQPRLTYRLIEEQTDYQWYRENGHWRYKRQVRDRPLKDGRLAVTVQQPANLAFTLTYGTYRLEVRDPVSNTVSSARIHAGWGSGSPDSDTPDRLGLRSDRKQYRPGEVAHVQVQAPFTGTVSLVLAADRVLSVQSVILSEREQVLDVPVAAEWGAGVYALVTAYRPDTGQVGHGPRRAVGVVWLGLAPELRQLDVTLEAPDTLRPRSMLEVAVQVSGQAAEERAYLTLAAVDEGLLQLTDYHNPDPLSYYFGQRALGVGLRDLYGRLIDGREGLLGQLRVGGGESGRRGAPDSHVRLVSLFSGVVRLDETGHARVPFAVPDFNGRLRLVAVAWSASKLGATAGAVTVRDPVVLMPSTPRFLAAGDQSQVTLLLQNVAGATGDYQLAWESSGALRLGDGSNQQTVHLAASGREVRSLPLAATAIGNGQITLRLTAPGGEVLEKTAEVGVRAAFLPQREALYGRLAAGANLRLGPTLAQGWRPETVSGLLSVGNRPTLDVPGLLRQLDLYPYGCLEQVTSRAFPLLHIERLATRWNYKSKTPVAERLGEAVSLILEKQLENGAFALWRAGGDEDPWLSAYALDFLQRARAAGVTVPDFAWERGVGWLRRQVVYPETQNWAHLAVQSYALYLLARQGEMHSETARYALDQNLEHLPSALAAAHLGAALHLIGDPARSKQAFTAALRLETNSNLHDYGSRLRDRAALLLILTELDENAPQLAALVDDLAQGLAKEHWLSTQEQAWMVRAVDALTGDGDNAPFSFKLQGQTLPERKTPLVLRAAADTLARGLELVNSSKAPLWYSLTVDGSPQTAPPPLQTQGFEVRRQLLGLDGQPLPAARVTQGELLVVLLDGKAIQTGVDHQALLVDPLPAGLEIENPNLANANSAGNLEWIGELTNTTYTEALDDRFIAALDLNGEQRTFRLAYLARAVTLGHYQAPPPEIEDMYKPRYRGRGTSSWLDVVPAH